MQKLTYIKRIAKLNLWSLEERRNRSDLIEVFKMAKNFLPIPLTKFFELNTDNRTRDHSFAPLQLRSPSSLLLSKSCQSLEYVGSRHYICKDCEWLQVKIRIATKKKNGPVSGLKSAGPHGRFQSFGAAGSVTYL